MGVTGIFRLHHLKYLEVLYLFLSLKSIFLYISYLLIRFQY